MFNLSSCGRATLKRITKITLICSLLLLVGHLFINQFKNYVEATSEGASVNVRSDENEIFYGHWSTSYFTISTPTGDHRGFCAQPSLDTPTGEFSADVVSDDNTTNKFKLLKLMIYINTVGDETGSVRQAIADNWGDDADTQYAWSHAVIGAIYDNDYKGLYDENNEAKVNGIIDILQGYINSQDISWLKAKSYQLYLIHGGGGEQDVVWIEGPNYIHGKINIQKCDIDTSQCQPQAKSSLSGIEFSVYNESGEKIYIDAEDRVVDSGALVSQGSTSQDGQVSFENLPRGKYSVKETATNDSYVLSSQNQSVEVNQDGAVSNLKFYDRVVRGDLKFVKKDDATNQPIANAAFRITSKTTGENHLVVSNSNGVINTASSFARHSNHTNGYDGLNGDDQPVFKGYGTWFGTKSNNTNQDSVGALPYDTYEIQELKCDANKFCYDVKDQKQTVTINQDGTVKDLGQWQNDCAEFSVGTTASDAEDGDKFIQAGETAKIKDTVEYCVKKNMEYTIKGVLMDKKTGQKLLINGQPVEQTITVNPAETCSSADMIFEFDASELAGSEIVVFESLYYEDELKAEHKDLTDEDQTVNVVSLGTTAVDKKDDDKFIIAEDKAQLKDTVSYCAKANTTFTIKGTLMNKKTGQPILVNHKLVQKSVTITPAQACGQADMVFTFDASQLGGVETVVFESLYYQDRVVISHNDLSDEGQTVNIISLGTFATDRKDGDKWIPAKKDAEIKDVVKYCLKPGLQYSVKGVLMDKSTGERVMIDGWPIEQIITFVPEEPCGEIEMYYKLDASNLGGKELVFFENLYQDNQLLIEHDDLDNPDETIFVELPAPDTGAISVPSTGSKETNNAPIAIAIGVACSCGYILFRLISRKKFLKLK